MNECKHLFPMCKSLCYKYYHRILGIKKGKNLYQEIYFSRIMNDNKNDKNRVKYLRKIMNFSKKIN